MTPAQERDARRGVDLGLDLALGDGAAQVDGAMADMREALARCRETRCADAAALEWLRLATMRAKREAERFAGELDRVVVRLDGALDSCSVCGEFECDHDLLGAVAP